MRKPDDSGLTTSVVGVSYSGKTHLLVELLNQIKGKKRGGSKSDPWRLKPMYQMIFMFTSSPHAKPLKDVKLPETEFKVIGGYPKKILYILKRIQDISKNKLAWMVITDDLFRETRGLDTTSLFLTMRNSNISTFTLNQGYKSLVPAARKSAHRIIITELHSEWEDIIQEGYLHEVEKLLGVHDQELSIRELAKRMVEYTGTNIAVLDNKRKKIVFIKREPFK